MTMRYMNFKNLLIILCLAFCFKGYGQSTTVSATVQDPSGQVWANGTISYTFQGNGSFSGAYQWQGANLPSQYLKPQIVQLNGSGYGTFVIPSSNFIYPSGSQWLLTVCPNASFGCSTLALPINGGSADLSSFITSMLSPITIPGLGIPLAYTTGSVLSTLRQGSILFNTTTNFPMYYDGSVWHNFSISSGTVTNFSVGSFPSFLIPTVINPTTSPSLSISASTIPVNAGGTGVTAGTGYAQGNGTSPFTFSPTIPYSALTGTPAIPSSANWPNAGSCGTGYYVSVLTNGAAPTCTALPTGPGARICPASGEPLTCYIIAADGTITQWGQYTLPATGTYYNTATITFPHAFTTTSIVVTANTNGACSTTDTTTPSTLQVSSQTATTVSLFAARVIVASAGGSNFDVACIINWQAIGQ